MTLLFIFTGHNIGVLPKQKVGALEEDASEE